MPLNPNYPNDYLFYLKDKPSKIHLEYWGNALAHILSDLATPPNSFTAEEFNDTIASYVPETTIRERKRGKINRRTSITPTTLAQLIRKGYVNLTPEGNYIVSEKGLKLAEQYSTANFPTEGQDYHGV